MSSESKPGLFKQFIQHCKTHKSLTYGTIITTIGFIASIKVFKDDSDTKWRRHEGIFKDRDRLNHRRMVNGLSPLPDNDFRDPKLQEEWMQWKKHNNVKY